ncbi:MAG: DUF1304 domain-containing protein [Nostoc sp. GBBB01]|nr:DUF1304 domain-containing protein [Nostoc sp. GBBB01]
MKLFADLAVSIVALLHLGIAILEIFFWESPISLRAFKLSPEIAKATTRLAANQGVYNGFLVAGLLWGLVWGEQGFLIKVFLLSCIVVAGIFGGVTVNRSIFLIQGIPGAIALVLVVLANQNR